MKIKVTEEVRVAQDKHDIMLEKGDVIQILSAKKPLTEAVNPDKIRRGWIRDRPLDYEPDGARRLYNLKAPDLIGWFANKYNLASGWHLYKATDAEKREFGRDVVRSFSDWKKTTSIIRFNLTTGTYAFVDNEAYLNGDVRFDKMTAYDRIIIEPTDLAYAEFNIDFSL